MAHYRYSIKASFLSPYPLFPLVGPKALTTLPCFPMSSSVNCYLTCSYSLAIWFLQALWFYLVMRLPTSSITSQMFLGDWPMLMTPFLCSHSVTFMPYRPPFSLDPAYKFIVLTLEDLNEKNARIFSFKDCVYFFSQS